MKQFEIVIANQTGLHARPAKELANLAKKFQSKIRIQHGEKKVDARSLLSLLTLGVEPGCMIQVEVEGKDETEASDALYQAIESGLGEGSTSRVQHDSEPVASSTPPAHPLEQNLPTPPGETPGLLYGIACSPGFAIGPVFFLPPSEIHIDDHYRDITSELSRFHAACQQARTQLETLSARMSTGQAKSEAAIIEVHLSMLEDEELVSAVADCIQTGNSAGRAVKTIIAGRTAELRGLKDPLLAARGSDLEDVGNRILRILAGEQETPFTLPNYPAVLLAEEFSPSITAGLDRERVLGLCSAAGGATSHMAILARALGLPAVTGVGAHLMELENQVVVIVDGSKGTITVAPDETTLKQARLMHTEWQKGLAQARDAASLPAVTRDGHRVEIAANIGGIAEAQKAVAAGADGVGLLRTEFIFLKRATAPDEAEQTEIYTNILNALQGKPVVIRTMDIGGDKLVGYIQIAPEANPFLGVRGLRLSLAYPDLLRQQLRAIYRAAPAGVARIMFPMVSDIQEWTAVRQIATQVQQEVSGPELELGIMIEVPAAALVAKAFARECDFFSIGTNDLTQYTLAMDRGNPDLAKKSDGLHPAVLKLIALTVEAAHSQKRWVGVCGELGADEQAVPILVGLGVDELSANLAALPSIKARVRTLDYRAAQDLAQRALACETATEVRRLSLNQP